MPDIFANVKNWQPAFTIAPNQTATVSISGNWKFDPRRVACGAAGVGGPIADGGFREAAAPIGACCWKITAYKPVLREQPDWQHATGWFTSDNQTITWNDTSDGSGEYWFGINDNDNDDGFGDNSGILTYTVKINAKP